MKPTLVVLAIGLAVLAVAWVVASNLPPEAAALVFPIVGPVVIIGVGLTTVLLKNARERRSLRK